LGQLLGGRPAKGEAGVDERVRELVGRRTGTVTDRVEARLPGIGEPLVQALEHVAFVEIGKVDGVTCLAQLVGERSNAAGQPVPVVIQNNLSHIALLQWRVTQRSKNMDRSMALV